MKKVEIDKGSGFCFGVVNAIKHAEEELAKGEVLYCLGDIVHNSREVERLKQLGLITINHDEFRQLKGVKVLLRAHGEPPETYEIAHQNGIEIIDATCPVVLRLQKRIKQSYQEGLATDERQIVIYGKNGHAEVLGLVGQTAGQALVIESVEEAHRIDFGKDIRLFSQTTKSLEGFHSMISYIKEHTSPQHSFEYADTICRQVANRMPRLREFAASHDLILFVSGKKSSNGKVLFDECRQINAHTFLVEGADDIEPAWLTEAESIGICGATSTPKWLMEEVQQRVQQLLTSEQ